MHRNIMKAFEEVQGETARKDLKVLYRIMEEDSDTVVYIQSEATPDWGDIAKGYINCGVKDISPVVDNLKEGYQYQFSLMCMPSKKINRGGKNSQRTLLKTEDERLNWLKSKGVQFGFNIIWCNEKLQQTQFLNRGGKWMFGSVEFRGVLKVTNKDNFTKAYREGIGPEKAYGMGMLLLSRA